MITKKITYENFDGEKVSEDLMFHISKVDLLVATTEIEKLTLTEDMSLAFPILKKLLVTGYGVREGELFIQSDAVKQRLLYTPMMDELIFDLLQNPKEMVRVIIGMLPADVSKKLHTTKEGIKALEEVNEAIEKVMAEEEELKEVEPTE